MRYISTRGTAPHLSFGDAMMTGLARDGGLYVPERLPRLSADEITALRGLSYEDIAYRIMRPFVAENFDELTLRRLIAAAYGGFAHRARAPLVQLGAHHFLLELFHGPTLAFKDFAMQMIGQMMQETLTKSGQRIVIVGATSGDTGAAAMEAFRGLSNIDLFILYPHDRVSEVQRRQMTTPPEANVHALAIDGDFDDAQARVKDMFNDHAFRDEVHLAGVNSINWARILAQVVYYFASGVELGAPERAVNFTVPTGNFGDIFAGYIACQMGLPIEKLVIATNQNDILHRAFRSGVYRSDGVKPSISPSMDIQVSSNFERALFDAYGRDGAQISALMARLGAGGGFDIAPQALDWLRGVFVSGSCDEAQTLATIRETYSQTGNLLCPHSAVGVSVAHEHLGAVPMITLATAHAAKFPEAVAQASGVHPPLPPHMSDLFAREERITHVPNDLGALQNLIRERMTS